MLVVCLQIPSFIFFAAADETLVLLLDHSNREVVYNVCGVIMNLMADATHKHVLISAEGVDKYVRRVCMVSVDMFL